MMEAKLMITCGTDWAEDHHDVALADESGKLLAKRRIGDAAFQVKGVGLDSREARAVLAAAPEPAAAARLSAPRLRSVLRKTGRQRYIDSWVERLRPIFAAEQLHQLPAVEQAMGRQTLALVSQLDAACRAADDLAEAAAAAFAAHPDAEILISFPGIGPVTGARVLAEIGDDRARFRDARGLKAYAGSAPVTIASGKSLVVRNRKVKNQRLAAAGYLWIFGALPSPVIKEHYDRRRGAGDAQPVQPAVGLSAPLPADRPAVRPRQGIPHTGPVTGSRRGLTVSKIGCLWMRSGRAYLPDWGLKVKSSEARAETRGGRHLHVGRLPATS